MICHKLVAVFVDIMIAEGSCVLQFIIMYGLCKFLCARTVVSLTARVHFVFGYELDGFVDIIKLTDKSCNVSLHCLPSHGTEILSLKQTF